MIVLLPCYSLEDFSLYRDPDEANDIFAAWTALFHPLLLEHEGELPEWEPAGSPDTSRVYSLVVVPPSCESTVPQEAMQTLEDSGAILIRGCSTREEIVAESLRHLGKTDLECDSDLVDSFYSLALVYFVSDLLTRKLRYMSDIDSTELGHDFFNALKAYREGNLNAVKDELQKGFDRVCEATEYYFPTPAKFVDLTRLSPDDAPDSLRNMLQRRAERGEKTNLLPDVHFIRDLDSRYPNTLDLLREEIKNGRVQLFGTDAGEEPLYLLPQTEIVRRLVQGRDAIVALLHSVPCCFGRTRAGLTPVLPQLLRLCGYQGALLFTSDGWTTDHKNQTRLNWKDRSGSVIPTLAKTPVDAENAAAFMELLEDLGYAWHNDDVMTTVFAHAPDREVPWWADTERANRFAPVFAEVTGIREYIELTEKAGMTRSLGRDDFRTNCLTRAAQSKLPDPVSQWSRFYSEYFRHMTTRGYSLLQPAVQNETTDEQGTLFWNSSLYSKIIVVGGRPIALPAGFSKHVLAVGSLDERTGTILELPPMSRVWLQFEKEPVDKPKRKKKKKKSPRKPEESATGPVHAGLWQRVKRRFWHSQSESTPAPRLVELVSVRHSRSETESYYMLRNERFELRIDPVTGAMRRLATPTASGGLELSKGLLRRPGFGNRFSWQLALKLSESQLQSDLRDPDSVNYGYSIMAADKFRILEDGPVKGKLQITGRLVLPDGNSAAKFVHTITLLRNSPVIDVEATFVPDILPAGHSWDNYFGCRFAWKDPFAEVRTGVHEMLWKTDREFLQAPECLDIRADADVGITILSNGLPFYRLRGSCRLDSVLMPKNESQQTFHFGIGVDLPDPVQSSLAFMAPEPLVEKNVKKPACTFSRFLELQSLSGAVLPVDIEPVYNADNSKGNEPDAFRLTLLERAGTQSNASLLCQRPMAEVKVVDLSCKENISGQPVKVALENEQDENERIDATPTETSEDESESLPKDDDGKSNVNEASSQIPPVLARRDEHSYTIHLERNRLLPLECRFNLSESDETKEMKS